MWIVLMQELGIEGPQQRDAGQSTELPFYCMYSRVSFPTLISRS